MDDSTKSMVFILFIISIIALSAYSAINSMSNGDVGGEFSDLEKAQEDTTEKKKGVSLITLCEGGCFG